MKVFVPSSPAANGACWLLNCFLELDIMVYRASLDSMWGRKDAGVPVAGERGVFPADNYRRVGWELRPAEFRLQVHFPIFARKKEFQFIPDISIEWDHRYPREDQPYDKVILFVRDPRDALLSLYKRAYGSRQDFTYTDFCEQIHSIDCNSRPYNWLSRLNDWLLFHLMWLERKDILILRFEDYKSDSEATLRQALAYLGLHFSDARIEAALANSTHEKAREAEDQYYADHPEVTFAYRVNRSSKVNDYLGRPGEEEMAKRIHAATAGLLNRMGYSFAGAPPPPTLEDFYFLLLPDSEWYFSLPSSIKEKYAKMAASGVGIAGARPVYLFGCGQAGQGIAHDFAHWRFAGFIDNNRENWRKTVASLPVHSLEEIARLHPDALVLTTPLNEKVNLAMQAQCRELGLESKRFTEYQMRELVPGLLR